MKENSETAKAGSLLCIDRGVYSSYEVIGFFAVLSDFKPNCELAEFKALYKPTSYNNEDSNSFLAYLIKKGFLLEINYSDLYLGDYSLSDDEFRFTV